MQEKAVRFDCDGEQFTLQVRFPAQTPKGAVLVCHAWGGQLTFELDRAQQLADQGYIAIAHDVYGTHKRGTNPEENGALMRPLLEDREALARRILAGIEAAAALPEVDEEQLAAIGFCFGGLCVLDMARRNMPVKGVVSFHGLFTPLPLPSNTIGPKVLVLHGYDDPLASPQDMLGFADEMTAANADWQIHAYGGTSHSFSKPGANDPEAGNVYFQRSDNRATRSMLDFLGDLFAS